MYPRSDGSCSPAQRSLMKFGSHAHRLVKLLLASVHAWVRASTAPPLGDCHSLTDSRFRRITSLPESRCSEGLLCRVFPRYQMPTPRLLSPRWSRDLRRL